MSFFTIYLFLSIVNVVILVFGLVKVFSVARECEKIDINSLKKLQINYSDAAFGKIVEDVGIKNTYLVEAIKKLLLANQKGYRVLRSDFVTNTKKNILNFCKMYSFFTHFLAIGVLIVIAFLDRMQMNYLFFYALVFFLSFLLEILSEIFLTNAKTDNITEKLNQIYAALYIDEFDYDFKTNLVLNKASNELVEKNKQQTEKENATQALVATLSKIDASSDHLDKQVATFVETITKNTNTESVAVVVDNLKRSIVDMTASYNKIFRTSEAYEKEILKYTEFFQNFNEIGSTFQETAKELGSVLAEIEKASNLSTKDQVASIDANLRKIITKQINEIKDIVQLYNESIFGRIAFIMSNNLERSTQTLTAMNQIYEQNQKHLILLREYADKVEACTTTNVMHNQKIFNLVDSNTQLVGFILKRYKFVDGKFFDKVKSMVSASPIEETNGNLEYLASEVNALKQKISSLK